MQNVAELQEKIEYARRYLDDSIRSRECLKDCYLESVEVDMLIESYINLCGIMLKKPK